jgi:hypothetical protein
MPKTMPRMTKEGEVRLRAALDEVVDLVNDGKDPDDAIVQGGVRTLDLTWPHQFDGGRLQYGPHHASP